MTTVRARSLFWPTLMAVAGALMLVGLGTWQLERKAWKERLLERIDARSRAEPIVLDAAASLFGSGEDLEYTRVRARGRLLNDRMLLLFQAQGTLPGYHVYAPLETPSGRVLMVNRGFVPQSQVASLKTSADARPALVDMVGLLRRPGQRAYFDPQNDAKANRWYWRDLDGMLEAAMPDGRRDAYPFYLEIEAQAAGAAERGAGIPRPGVTRVELPNKHLQYAMTWYGLAVTLIGVYLAFLRSRRTPRRTFGG